MPGAPSSSWPLYKARLRTRFEGANLRVCAAFWLFGLINNILYVLILSAAIDLVSPIPVGTVLLADVVPSFLTKLTAPYYIHHIPYPLRILIFCSLSSCGMLLIALSPPTREPTVIIVKMLGIVLASLSSGGGELSFLGLTHYYGGFSLASWGSGTGGAGLIGAGAYAIATTNLGLSVQTTLLASAVLPLIMLLSFFILLPPGPLRATTPNTQTYTRIPTDDPDTVSRRQPSPSASPPPSTFHTLLANLRRSRALLLPYMLPLFLVYVAEYSLNQGILPITLFPLHRTPFTHYRAFYPTYSALYQLGVFLSRSSLPFLRIRNLYIPTYLQIANFALLTSHALWPFIPSVWIVFVVVFWEGLLGGLVYVSTFAAVREEMGEDDREFSLGAVTVSDSAGICVAGFMGMALETGVCAWQVRHGRGECRML
ncbi:hypothetical protein MBLNU230_g8295t1 [Neophaeotheca triangularis]